LAVDAIRQSLACSPADPFFWLALYALEPSAPLNYLTASYRLGPNEGWIALKRNLVAFANFDELPDDLRRIVVQFVKCGDEPLRRNENLVDGVGQQSSFVTDASGLPQRFKQL
jgi:hypothetical protein